MSAFPQIVWRPSPKDVVTEFAPRIGFGRVAVAQAAVLVAVATDSLPNFIPIDQVFIMRHALLHADPGAAQILQNATLNILQQTTQVLQLAGGPDYAPIVAGGPSVIAWTGEIVLSNTETIQGACTFDLGAAANTVILTVGGYFVPRGNWQR